MWAVIHATGVWPSRLATLEVRGRRTGRLISFPVVIADYEGDQYLVSMLGENTNWVRNVRAADGRATLRRGRREAVRLEEVERALRAPVVRRYLACAPGSRPHIPIDRDAPLEEFERLAPEIPVFRIVSDPTDPRDTAPQPAAHAHEERPRQATTRSPAPSIRWFSCSRRPDC
jgi:hypothetical protein